MVGKFFFEHDEIDKNNIMKFLILSLDCFTVYVIPIDIFGNIFFDV